MTSATRVSAAADSEVMPRTSATTPRRSAKHIECILPPSCFKASEHPGEAKSSYRLPRRRAVVRARPVAGKGHACRGARQRGCPIVPRASVVPQEATARCAFCTGTGFNPFLRLVSDPSTSKGTQFLGAAMGPGVNTGACGQGDFASQRTFVESDECVRSGFPVRRHTSRARCLKGRGAHGTWTGGAPGHRRPVAARPGSMCRA